MDSLPGFGEGKDNWTLRYKRPELSAKAKSSPPGLYRPWLADVGWEQGIETSPPRLCQPGHPHYYSFLSKRGFYFCCKVLDAFQSPDSSPLEGCWDFIFYSGSSRMLGGWGGGSSRRQESETSTVPIISEEDTALWRALGKMLECPHGLQGLAQQGLFHPSCAHQDRHSCFTDGDLLILPAPLQGSEHDHQPDFTGGGN